MNQEVNFCWGDPDCIIYTTEDDGQKHELNLKDNGYAFGIWDGVFIIGNDNDDTAGLNHTDFLMSYIYNNGWPKRDIVPLKDVQNGACDYYVSRYIPVEYEYSDYYDENDNVLPEYKMT